MALVAGAVVTEDGSEVLWVPKLEGPLHDGLWPGSHYGLGDGTKIGWVCGIRKLARASISSMMKTELRRLLFSFENSGRWAVSSSQERRRLLSSPRSSGRRAVPVNSSTTLLVERQPIGAAAQGRARTSSSSSLGKAALWK